MWRSTIVCLLLATSLLKAQPTPLRGTAELHELLDRLNVVGTVLMLGAHPDDENTSVLAYFARGRHLRTVYFSATRGEGGQNLIGTEQGDLMGVIRTHELLEARRIDGGEQEFAEVVDFGYTKTPEEALSVWGEDQLLRDMVRVIRKVRPDVIVSRFPPRPGNGGHGHHTAVGWTGPLALEAAADASQFAELGLPAWRTRRYYYNLPTFSRRMEETAARGEGRLRLEVGAYDPVLGKSYAEVAGESRSMHRSQGMGTVQRKGSVPAFFEFVAGESAVDDLFSGIDTSWGRVEGGRKVGTALQQARDQFDPREPHAIVPMLLNAYQHLAGLAGPEVEYKRSELQRAIELASGIWVDATADRWDAAPGSTIEITAQALRRSESPWEWLATRLEGVVDGSLDGPPALELNRVAARTAMVTIPGEACYSQPHWLRTESADGPHCETAADTPGPATVLRAVFEFRTPEGIDIEIEKPVVYRWIDRSIGERSRPLAIVPAVTVAFSQQNRIFPDTTPTAIRVRLASNVGRAAGVARLRAPAGWSVSPESQQIHFDRRGQERTAEFELTPPARRSGGELTATVTLDGKTISSGMQTIEYDHIPMTPVFPPAKMRVERFDMRLLSKEVGYVMGAGDKIPDALAQMGATVTLLSAEELAAGNLDRYDAIVTGIRALNTRPDLLAARERVMAYVENGGTLVVQYNTASFRGRGGGATATLAPYPMTASRLRVTDERAAIEFPSGEHALLSVPNKIAKSDFDGWVQERGLYFMSGWDERYEAVLACADPGDSPLEGGMLYTRYGKGVYIFTGYSWFRQLPAGVPGAYRIFANLISAGNALAEQ